MKHILLFFLCNIYLSSYSQNTDNKILYKADAMIMYFVNSNNEIIGEKPFGNKVTIIYDKFFKSYYIEFDKEDGTSGFYQFYFVSDEGDNTKRMKNDNNSIALITDDLESQGKLLIIREKKIDGDTACIVVIGAVRKK